MTAPDFDLDDFFQRTLEESCVGEQLSPEIASQLSAILSGTPLGDALVK